MNRNFPVWVFLCNFWLNSCSAELPLYFSRADWLSKQGLFNISALPDKCQSDYKAKLHNAGFSGDCRRGVENSAEPTAVFTARWFCLQLCNGCENVHCVVSPKAETRHKFLSIICRCTKGDDCSAKVLRRPWSQVENKFHNTHESDCEASPYSTTTSTSSQSSSTSSSPTSTSSSLSSTPTPALNLKLEEDCNLNRGLYSRGNCFTVQSEPKTFQEAVNECESKQKILALVQDQEPDTMKEFLEEDTWVGLRFGEKNWQWLTEKNHYEDIACTDIFWKDPSTECKANNNNKCCILDSASGSLRSAPCDSKRAFLCERRPDQTVETDFYLYLQGYATQNNDKHSILGGPIVLSQKKCEQECKKFDLCMSYKHQETSDNCVLFNVHADQLINGKEPDASVSLYDRCYKNVNCELEK